MRIRKDLPRPFRTIENEWIPLADGTRLAARIWLPEGCEDEPVPAILEYLPYRKRDLTRMRDEPMHQYFAGYGYASLRVDVRGSGDSEGLLDDEYSQREIEDGAEVIAWIAAQPWCGGRVGMTGISWGGFNSLQVAALAPPALGAIITLCASDDRYSDDAHYMGGCLLNENQIWGTVLFGLGGLPPDPEIVGDRWRDTWMARLEHDKPFAAEWLRHQRRDEFWKHGSVCEDFTRIRCPVYAIGGWADGYSNAVPRLLAGLDVPRKGLVGPWAHDFPHDGIPGPRIGYLQEAVRWWDHWLRDVDTGIMDEPMLRAWMQESVIPAPYHPERPGRWVAEETWPAARVRPRVYHLTGAPALTTAPAPDAALEICSPQTTGAASGDWCGFGNEGEAPRDQRMDDGCSLVFDSAPLDEAVEILGAVEATLVLASNRAVATVAVRLCDVAPDGASLRVTFGILNLTHRNGHELPELLAPGKRHAVRVQLNDIAHRFPAGHVVRLAISTTYWPIAWPAPEAVTLTLSTAGSTLSLPVRPPDSSLDALPAFPAPEAAVVSSRHTALKPQRTIRSIQRDLTTNDMVYLLYSEGGDLETGAIERIEGIDLDVGHTVERRFTIGERDPDSARAFVRERLMLRRSDWRIDVDAQTELRGNRTEFRARSRLEARENGEVVFAREWDEGIKRDRV